MALQDLALPVDIPWERLGASSDMMDVAPGDFRFPPRWRSSISAFYFEPETTDLPESYCDRKITYLKIVCTITGYQPDQETGVDQPPLDGSWHSEPAKLGETVWPCYGALLQVAVFPEGDSTDAVPLHRYPYIINFEPKRRELYEAVTRSGEVLGRSASTLSVLKGATSTDTTEIASKVGAAVSVGFAAPGFAAGGSLSYENSDKHGTAFTENNVRTTDESRERRETYASSTSLTQMYELFTAYHLGTNRALFFLVSRPHTVEDKDQYTFVNGPRRLEGIQEVFLVISRPADMPGLCLEAFLETAHLLPDRAEPVPLVESEPEIEFEFRESDPIPIGGQWNPNKGQNEDGELQDFELEVFTLGKDCEIDLSRGGRIYTNPSLPWQPIRLPQGYDIQFDFSKSGGDWIAEGTTDGRALYDVRARVEGNTVKLTITLRYRGVDESRFRGRIIVYYKCPKAATPPPAPTEPNATLFLTSRGLTACVTGEAGGRPRSTGIDRGIDLVKALAAEQRAELAALIADRRAIELEADGAKQYRAKLEQLMKKDPSGFRRKATDALEQGRLDPLPREWLLADEWVSFETPIVISPSMTRARNPALQRIRVSNELGGRIAELMLSSVGSPSRYMPRTIDFWRTAGVVRRLSRQFARMPEEHLDNVPVTILSVPYRDRILAVFGRDVKRAELLRSSPIQLQRFLGLGAQEAYELKAALVQSDLPITVLDLVEPEVAGRFREVFPEVKTRAEALRIPLEQLRRQLALSMDQAVELRLRLMGAMAPNGPGPKL